MSQLEFDVRQPWFGATRVPQDVLFVEEIILTLQARG